MVAAIATALEARGLSAPAADCPAERARIERSDDSIALSIVDIEGRAAQRVVADPSTAVMLIESFAATEPTPMPEMAAATAIDRDEPTGLAAPRAAIVVAVRGSLAVTGESSVAPDGSVWYGARASACVRLGVACVGAAARVASDAGVSGDAELGEASRTAADILLVGELPVVRDHLVVTPGLGIGLGWLKTRRTYTDTTNAMSDTVEADTGGLRLDAHISVTWPIAQAFSLRFGAAICGSPFAHVAPFVEETREAPGEPRVFGRVELGVEVAR